MKKNAKSMTSTVMQVLKALLGAVDLPGITSLMRMIFQTSLEILAVFLKPSLEKGEEDLALVDSNANVW